jgi:hypothetical protein
VLGGQRKLALAEVNEEFDGDCYDNQMSDAERPRSTRAAWDY